MTFWQSDPIAVPAEGRMLLDAIAGSESPGYDVLYGGGRFQGFQDHPRQAIPIQSGPNAGRTSSAAGRYQFLAPTWDRVSGQLGLPDFSPANQDAAAWHLAQQTYRQKTGMELLPAIQAAGNDRSALDAIGRQLSGVWTSLPGGIEPNRASNAFAQRMETGRQSQAWWQSDPVVEPQTSISAAVGASGQMPSVAAGASASVPSMWQGMGIDFKNIGSAAGQLTTPDISSHMPNLLSDDAHQTETGEIVFRDKSGAMVPTDRNKHVVLRDPSDNRVKVFARTDDTNEGQLASAGRLLMTGMASGPPSARPGLVAANPSRVPTSQELKSAATAGYNSPEVVGLELRPSSLPALSQRIQMELNEAGIGDMLAPKTFGILSKAEKIPDGAVAVTGRNAETFRRMLGNAAASADATEAKAAKQAINALDDFMGNIPADQVVRGNASQASATLRDARANYGAAMRSDAIDRKVAIAEHQAGAANSGQNIGNALRQRVRSILDSTDLSRGYTKGQLAAMEGVVKGTASANTTRFVGNMLGGGGGLGAVASAGVGGFATGGWGAIAPVVGYGFKKLSNALTGRQIDALTKAIRADSPLGRQVKGPVAEWSKAASGMATNPSPRAFAALNLASRNLSNNLKDLGITVSPSDLMRSLQGPVRSSAEDEQR